MGQNMSKTVIGALLISSAAGMDKTVGPRHNRQSTNELIEKIKLQMGQSQGPDSAVSESAPDTALDAASVATSVARSDRRSCDGQTRGHRRDKSDASDTTTTSRSSKRSAGTRMSESEGRDRTQDPSPHGSVASSIDTYHNEHFLREDQYGDDDSVLYYPPPNPNGSDSGSRPRPLDRRVSAAADDNEVMKISFRDYWKELPTIFDAKSWVQKLFGTSEEPNEIAKSEEALKQEAAAAQTKVDETYEGMRAIFMELNPEQSGDIQTHIEAIRRKLEADVDVLILERMQREKETPAAEKKGKCSWR